MTTINILGAGPAGLSAAINLAKSGYEIDVFEKKAEVGSRFHGDFQGLENWSDREDVLQLFKKMNIDINFKYNSFDELKIYNGSKIWNFKCKRPAFYLIKRGTTEKTLDNALKNQALDCGVDIHFKKTFPQEKADLIATGPIKNELFAAAKGITFKTSHKDIALGLVSNDAAFKGYSYLLIADGQGCMATVLCNDFSNLNACFLKTKSIFNKKFELKIDDIHKMGGVGCYSLKNIFKNGKSLYLGEAAGLQDFLWGFGIKSAVTSGYLTAKSIINGENYEKSAERFFRGKLKAGLVNRYLWEKFGSRDYSFIVNRIHGAKDPLNFLNYFYNPNFIHKLLYPPARNYMRRKYKNLRL